MRKTFSSRTPTDPGPFDAPPRDRRAAAPSARVAGNDEPSESAAEGRAAAVSTLGEVGRPPASSRGAAVRKGSSDTGADDDSRLPSELPGPCQIEDLYRFRAIPISPAMREEMLHARLPLAPLDQLRDTVPPRSAALVRADRGVATEPCLERPLVSSRADSDHFGGLTLFGLRGRRARNRRIVGALVLVLAVLCGVGLVLRKNREVQTRSGKPDVLTNQADLPARTDERRGDR